MVDSYILDVNVVLDYLLDRVDVSPRIYELFLALQKGNLDIGLSSSQIHTISFIPPTYDTLSSSFSPLAFKLLSA